MRVIACPECGIEVNVRAGSCSECGAMFSEPDLAAAEHRTSDARELAKAKAWVGIARSFYLAQASYWAGIAIIAARGAWVYGSQALYSGLAIIGSAFAIGTAVVADRVTVAPRGISLALALLAIGDLLRALTVGSLGPIVFAGAMTAMSCVVAWMLQGSAEVITRNPHLWDLGIGRNRKKRDDLATRFRSSTWRPWVRIAPFVAIGVGCVLITLTRPEGAELLQMRIADARAEREDELNASRGRLDDSVASLREAWNHNDRLALGACFAPDRKEKLLDWIARKNAQRDWSAKLPQLPESKPVHASTESAFVDYALLEGSLRVTFRPDPGTDGGWLATGIALR